MIPVYPCLSVKFFKFLVIPETFFARVYFSVRYLTCQSFARENWRNEVVKILRSFVFVLFWNLVFMCKSNQPRIYADLLKFQSRAQDSVLIIILTMSIIPFFIHSFHVLALVYEQEKPKNNM